MEKLGSGDMFEPARSKAARVPVIDIRLETFTEIAPWVSLIQPGGVAAHHLPNVEIQIGDKPIASKSG
jgi:hypothetical protein